MDGLIDALFREALLDDVAAKGMHERSLTGVLEAARRYRMTGASLFRRPLRAIATELPATPVSEPAQATRRHTNS
jgi:hypothetical protein